MRTKINLAIPAIILLFVSACAAPAPAQKPEIGPIAKAETAVALAWTEVILTQTAAAPTSTFTPPPPTNTPKPTITFTPAPQPIILKGSGDSVVDISKWQGVGLLKAIYNSGSNFIVSNYDKNGSHINTTINAIGSYSGTQLIDVFDEDHTARLEIKASGPWEIDILPLSSIRHVSIPGVIQGVGDDVIFFDGNSPDLLKADASQANSNFIVHAIATDGSYDTAFNEIAPYVGTAILNNTTRIIEVTAEGPWSIEVTTK